MIIVAYNFQFIDNFANLYSYELWALKKLETSQEIWSLSS